MGWTTLAYTREQLFAKVWESPVTHVAAEIGISDVGLAKICRRMDIPLPGRGYWARRVAGYKTTIPKLGPTKPGTMLSYATRRYEGSPADAEARSAVLEQIREQASSMPRIAVPPALVEPHKLVKQSLAVLEKASPDQFEELLHKRGCLDVLANGEGLGRAIRIMDTLLKAFEEQGHTVEVSAPVPAATKYGRTPSKTLVHIGSSTVQIGISERIRRSPLPYPEPPKPRGPYDYVPRPRRQYEYRPTGRLSLSIKNVTLPGAPERWDDSKDEKLEDFLNDFVASVVVAAEVQRLNVIRAEEERQARIRQERRYAAIGKINGAHAALLKDARSRVREWRLAKDLALLAKEVGDRASRAGEESAGKAVAVSWAGWAVQMARHLETETCSDFENLRSAETHSDDSWRHGSFYARKVSEAIHVAMSTVDEVLKEEESKQSW